MSVSINWAIHLATYLLSLRHPGSWFIVQDVYVTSTAYILEVVMCFGTNVGYRNLSDFNIIHYPLASINRTRTRKSNDHRISLFLNLSAGGIIPDATLARSVSIYGRLRRFMP